LHLPLIALRLLLCAGESFDFLFQSFFVQGSMQEVGGFLAGGMDIGGASERGGSGETGPAMSEKNDRQYGYTTAKCTLGVHSGDKTDYPSSGHRSAQGRAPKSKMLFSRQTRHGLAVRASRGDFQEGKARREHTLLRQIR
jgi:hypothetical protein